MNRNSQMKSKTSCYRIFQNINQIFKRLYNLVVYAFFYPKRIVLVTGYLDQVGFKYVKRNWGDDLNYYLIEHLSGKKVMSIRSILLSRTLFLSNYSCIGSIINDYYLNKRSVIWGSGMMNGDEVLSDSPQKILAVRGPLTREKLLKQGFSVPEVYGDPAILLPFIYDKAQVKRYKCGLVPHVLDYELENVKAFKKKYGNEVTIINLKEYSKWTDVIDVIRECEFIISSSLHGIIVSDAYRIPNVWIKLSEIVQCDGFKFQDYFSSVNRSCSEAIDLKNKEIVISDFYTLLSEYVIPEMNLLPLVKSCPFIEEERLKELVSSVNNNVHS